MKYDIELTLELSVLIITSIVLFVIFLLLLVSLTKNKGKITIDGADIGLNDICFHVCTNRTDRSIAYKIWVEIKTRAIGVNIDLEKDIVRIIHESYYMLFKKTRELIEEIPSNQLKASKELIFLTINFLNDIMRPYLTKWGVVFNEWYDKEKQDPKSIKESPVDIQKRFLKYNEMVNDLLLINARVVAFTKKLEEIAFNK